MVVGGAGIGAGIGWVFMKIHKLLPTDVDMDIILTLVTPYIMYMVAEEVHSSGVLAVVSGGLLMSNRRNHFLSSTARLRGENVWQSLVFLLNGLVFLLIGLDLPEIREGLRQEGVSLGAAIGYGLLITGVLIVVRFLASYGAVIVTIIASKFITVADPNPGYRSPLLLSWSGMRGVVSLAAALSIPVQLSDGTPFPHRNLILFITFVAIITTLLLQGLTLPILIRKIRLPDYKDYLPEEEATRLIRKGLAQHTLQWIEQNHREPLVSDTHLQQLASRCREMNSLNLESDLPVSSKEIHLDVLEQQRQWLLKKNNDPAVDEELIRKFLRMVDLEEEKIKSS